MVIPLELQPLGQQSTTQISTLGGLSCQIWQLFVKWDEHTRWSKICCFGLILILQIKFLNAAI